jgi:hypothetical protein
MFQLNMVRGALQDELDGFFSIIDKDVERLSSGVGKSAYCQARQKYFASAFVELNQMVCHEFYHHSDHRNWRGHRLLAVDGSIIELPVNKDLEAHFGKVNKQANHPGARISELYDPLNNLTVDLQIAPCSTDERTLTCHHLEVANPNDLVLYDRGYPAAWLVALHIAKGVHCCMRSPWNLYNETRDLLKSGKSEQIVTLQMSARSKQKCKELGISDAPVTVRLINVTLPDSDEQEVLITTLLDSDVYPHDEFAWLYHQRWAGEENYKSLKSQLEIENFTGYSKWVIEQDIQAKIVTKNIAAVLAHSAQKIIDEETRKQKRKRSYKLNFANALRKLKDNIVRLILLPSPEKLIRRLIKSFSKEKEAVRPDRNYDRPVKKAKPKFTMQYKRC